MNKPKTPKIDMSYFANEKPIGLLVSAVASKYQDSFLRLVTHDKVFSSITSSDHAVLRFLAFENLTSVELSRRLGVSKQAIGKTVGSLEQRGFIQRLESTTDKRKHVLEMTDKGSRLIVKSIEAAKLLEHTTEKLLGMKSFTLLKKLLIEIANTTHVGTPSPESAGGQYVVNVSTNLRSPGKTAPTARTR